MAYDQFKRYKELLKIKRNIFNQYKNNLFYFLISIYK